MTAIRASTLTVDPSARDSMLRDYHDARRREDQWRIPQILLALVTPILGLMSTLWAYSGHGDYATIAGALAVITGVAAALLAVRVWRCHKTAIGLANSFQEEYTADRDLLLNDPL
jgi:protein-S-isoprenylcysteine O-methyltransferase Ste14